MNEAELQSAVIEAAQLYGWRVHHGRKVQAKDGRWMTPISGDVGFPDLVLARDGKVLFVELKSSKGRLTPGQLEWAKHLPVIIWRPADWVDNTIVDTLKWGKLR